MSIVSINERELRVVIQKMFNCFPAGERSKAAGPEVYFEILHRIPLEYVKQAADWAARGKLGDAWSLPPPGRLARVAEELQWRGRKKQAAPVEQEWNNSPTQRAAIIIGFRNLISDLKSGKPIQPDMATAKVFRITKEE